MKSTKYILKLSIAFSIIIFVASCKKDVNNSTVNTTTNASTVLTETNVAYGTDANQVFDIYLPANRTDTATKLAILIHGGAWSAGDKSEFATKIAALQNDLGNYAIINLNYRLAAPPSTNLWPTQFDDVNAAFDFIVSKANYYHFNVNKTVVLGTSAGAQLALLKAYKNNTNNNIKVVIDYFGPTDMKDLYNFQTGSTKLLFELFMGGTPTTNASVYSSSSPINYVSSNAPATIIFHGTADVVVPYKESVLLDSVLQVNNVIHQYQQYAGEPHGTFSNVALIDSYNKAIFFAKANNK